MAMPTKNEGCSFFFVESNIKRTKNVIGGARKRAAYTIINSRRKHIVGVYFQSHEGEIFYKSLKKPKVVPAKPTPKAVNIEKTSISDENTENVIKEIDRQPKENTGTPKQESSVTDETTEK